MDSKAVKAMIAWSYTTKSELILHYPRYYRLLLVLKWVNVFQILLLWTTTLLNTMMMDGDY